MNGVEHHRDGDGSLILDERYFPILITKWSGAPTLELVATYMAWHDRMLDRAEFTETKVIHVTDATTATQPNPTVRQAIADGAKQRVAAMDRSLASYVSFTSLLVRGVLTVIGWVMGDKKLDPILTDSLVDSLQRAAVKLDQAGIPRPVGLEPPSYSLPEAAGL